MIVTYCRLRAIGLVVASDTSHRECQSHSTVENACIVHTVIVRSFQAARNALSKKVLGSYNLRHTVQLCCWVNSLSRTSKMSGEERGCGISFMLLCPEDVDQFSSGRHAYTNEFLSEYFCQCYTLKPVLPNILILVKNTCRPKAKLTFSIYHNSSCYCIVFCIVLY